MERIKITCYNEIETWTDREKAKEFYLLCMMNSEGSEKERYCNIYIQLCSGQTECNDEVDL